MLSYRVDGNLRIDKAIRFFKTHIRKDDVIVDVGCGIGIATEAIANKASMGTLLGLDLSEQNIWYANKTIFLKNCFFHCLDIVNATDHITKLLPKKPSVITMCDVIEHIPQDAVAGMFELYANIGAPNLKILLTFPSAHHIDLLRNESPGELQIIDNPISAEFLAREAGKAGFSISYFAMIDIWNHFDYVHCMLERTKVLRASLPHQIVPRFGLFRSLPNRLWMYLIRRLRRRRYITNIFDGEPGENS